MELFKEEDRHILLKLLQHYRYCLEMKIRKSLKQIIRDIEKEYALESVYFITFPSKEGIKSGGDDLRSLLLLAGLGKLKKSNRFIS